MAVGFPLRGTARPAVLPCGCNALEAGENPRHTTFCVPALRLRRRLHEARDHAQATGDYGLRGPYDLALDELRAHLARWRAAVAKAGSSWLEAGRRTRWVQDVPDLVSHLRARAEELLTAPAAPAAVHVEGLYFVALDGGELRVKVGYFREREPVSPPEASS